MGESQINSLSAKILQIGSESYFHSFSNADRKCWLMPEKNMNIGMNLYQPSSAKGKLMKRFFPFIKNSGFVRSRLGIERKQYDLNKKLKTLLEDLFQIKNPEFSLFCGTPSVHQKITIQISRGRKILGYCKITDQAEIKSIFKHEQQVLDELNKGGIKQIPQCLFCGTFAGDMDAFVQTTTKTNASKTLHKWDKRHWEFLEQLKKHTQQNIPFAQTDFSKMLNQLIDHLQYLPPNSANVVVPAINRIKSHYQGKEVAFSAFHADFTPWNMFIQNQRLFVFDWEYAKRTFPPFLDAFHFFAQTSFFEKKWPPEKTYSKYLSLKNDFSKYIPNPDRDFQCYLVAVTAQYALRNKGVFDNQVKNNMNNWLQLLSKFGD